MNDSPWKRLQLWAKEGFAGEFSDAPAQPLPSPSCAQDQGPDQLPVGVGGACDWEFHSQDSVKGGTGVIKAPGP